MIHQSQVNQRQALGMPSIEAMRLAALALALGIVLGVGVTRLWHDRNALLIPEFGRYARVGGRWAMVYNVGYNNGKSTDVIRYVEGADTPTFKPMRELYAADKASAYYNGNKIPDADPATFHHYFGGYAVDKNSAFFEGKKIPQSVGARFCFVSGDYYSDSKGVYCFGALVSDDPSSFQIYLTSPWARDRSDAYRGNEHVHAKDPRTFMPISFRWAKDAKAFYASTFSPDRREMRVPCDYDSMVVLDDTYAKDKDRGYFFGMPLVGSDPATFRVVGVDQAEDKFALYHGYARVPQTLARTLN
jgi:hypothetical protein